MVYDFVLTFFYVFFFGSHLDTWNITPQLVSNWGKFTHEWDIRLNGDLVSRLIYLLLSGKLPQKWNMAHFQMIYIETMKMFHSYVSLLEGIPLLIGDLMGISYDLSMICRRYINYTVTMEHMGT